MRVILLPHGVPTMTAASSISPESCNIAFVPLLDANGMNLTPPTMIQIAIADISLPVVDASKNENEGVLIKEKKTAPNDKAGIKYGKNETLPT